MDSITQAALGAAAAHLCWQDKLGRKSLFLGAFIGTIPDLDILLYPLLDEVQRLYWHRGESHSIWFILLGTIAIGHLLRIPQFSKKLGPIQAMAGVFLILITHVIIDLFTVYGTQLLAPISREGFALNNMFIIDPLFTFPLLFGIIGAYFVRSKTAAARINQVGLLVVAVYAAWSFSAQAVAHQKFCLALEDLDFKIKRQKTSASPFNTILWRHIAEVPDGFLLGYWSWLDDENQRIDFQFIPKNAANVEPIKYTRTFEVVEWFSKGWWFTLKTDNNRAKVVDLRFTELPSATAQPYTQWQWPFAWDFNLAAQNSPRIIPIRPELDDPATTLKILSGRIMGQPGWVRDAK